MSSAALDQARGLLADARRVVVLTGAGVSAESGIPTFRGEGGLWRNHRPEELATPQAFRRDPALVWAWYAWRRELIRGCEPNDGHRALAALADGPAEVTLVTQNVDDLHERAAAGSGAREPLHLHGRLLHDRCTACDHRAAAAAGPSGGSRADPDGDPRGDRAHPPPPRCPSCGSLLRPDVVWFGEALDPAVLEAAFGAARAADLCLVVGTSAVVHPAASIPLATLEAGGVLVEVNPEPTPLSRWAAAAVRETAGRALPRLVVGSAGSAG